MKLLSIGCLAQVLYPKFKVKYAALQCFISIVHTHLFVMGLLVKVASLTHLAIFKMPFNLASSCAPFKMQDDELLNKVRVIPKKIRTFFSLSLSLSLSF